MTDGQIAREILDLESGLKVRFRTADPSIFHDNRLKDGMRGPPVSEGMASAGVHFIKADNNRVAGWQQIHHRLKVDEEGKPMFYARNNLAHFWRTMALMVEDERNPEDIKSDRVPDHIPDLVRYAVMTRPIRPKLRVQPDIGSFQYERRKFLNAKRYASRHGCSMTVAYGRVSG